MVVPRLFFSYPEPCPGTRVEHQVLGFPLDFHGHNDGPVPHFYLDGINKILFRDAEIAVAQPLCRCLPKRRKQQQDCRRNGFYRIIHSLLSGFRFTNHLFVTN